MQCIHDNKGQHSQTYQIEDPIHALPQRQQSRDRLTQPAEPPHHDHEKRDGNSQQQQQSSASHSGPPAALIGVFKLRKCLQRILRGAGQDHLLVPHLQRAVGHDDIFSANPQEAAD